MLNNSLRAALCALLVLSCAAQGDSPVPADELSLLNGAEYFDAHCAECHGWLSDDQNEGLYSADPEEETFEILVDLEEDSVYGPDGQLIVEPEDDWPEWAGPAPVHTPTEEEQLKSEVLDELTSAIDDAYRDEPRADWEDDDAAESPFADSVDYLGAADDGTTLMPEAVDLTDPMLFIYGTTETELFITIARGTGPLMPGFQEQLGSEEAIWDIVNYIRSTWGEDWLD